MKYLLSFLFVGIHLLANAQNQISTPVGQSLRIKTDTMFVKGNVRIDSGFVKLGNYRFVTLTKGASNLLNSLLGPNSGNLTMTGRNNTFFGENSGQVNATGNNNTFMGTFSGMSHTAGGNNTFVGYKSGYLNTTGQYNVLVGATAGNSNVSGGSNVFVGMDAGYSNSTGGSNVFLGYGAGLFNVAGAKNTAIGHSAGYNNTGAGNVFIGYRAGYKSTGNNKLYIANDSVSNPLIYGEFGTVSPAFVGKVVINGRVSINSSTFPTSVGAINTSDFKLFVNGGLLAKNIVINTSWADYVFEDAYKLKSLTEVEKFIKENGHLPNIPTAKHIEESGANVGEITRLQQEKIEELTLYAIDHDKQIRQNDEVIRKQESEIRLLTELLQALEKRASQKKR